MAKKETIRWLGHPVRDEEHQRDLELKAAIYQFHHGLDRAAAEKRVQHEDRVERHQKAAAHHLDGMRAANAIGNHEDAQQHHAMYTLHVKALGHNPDGAVPTDVTKWQGDKAEKRAYTFKGHDDDQFLVQPVRETPPLAKAEGDQPNLTVHPGGGQSTSPQMTGSECPNCGAQQTPIEKQNDYCRGCAKEFKDAIATRAAAKLGLAGLINQAKQAQTPEQQGGAKSQILDYLKGLGIEGAQVEQDDEGFTVPAVQVAKPPLRVFQGTDTPTAPKFGHLRVVKHEEWPHILNLWNDLAKDEPEQRDQRVKQFDVRKTWLRHKHLPEEKAFDYSAWLTPEQRQNGYRMFVLSHGNGNPVRAHVVHSNRKAGSATGNVDQGDLEVESYNLAGSGHHDRGLEASMLNAMMGHAKTHMGANYLSHGWFTPQGSAFIEAIAKPHGFQLGEPEDLVDGERPVDQPAGRATTGGVRMYSDKRPPRATLPRIHAWWKTGAEEND